MKVRPLKGYGAFDAVLRRGRRIVVGPMVLVMAGTSDHRDSRTSFPRRPEEGQQSDLPMLYYGVTIGKRTARSSVLRSRVRRLLREAGRRVLPRYAQQFQAHHITRIVCMWRSAPSHPSRICLSEVETTLESAMRKAWASGYES